MKGSNGMKRFQHANRNSFCAASANCAEAFSACSYHNVIVMGAIVMASIILSVIRLQLLAVVVGLIILEGAVLAQNSR